MLPFMALYSSQNVPPAHQLYFTWSGWPHNDADLPLFSTEPDAAFFAALADEWRADGLTLLSRLWAPSLLQLSFAVEPTISPVFFTRRAKGRLQYALRRSGRPTDFSRKVAMRAIGNNITDVVIAYLRAQLKRAEFADSRYRSALAEQAWEDAGINLAEATHTHSGRYWYNLHLVLVTAGRYRMGQEDFLLKLRGAAREIARRENCLLKSIAIMPDHVHMALRGNIERSALDIGLAFQNGLAAAAGCRLWQDGFYAGTFSEYDLHAVQGTKS
jgi:REP element-mobilizing transposase RayT